MISSTERRMAITTLSHLASMIDDQARVLREEDWPYVADVLNDVRMHVLVMWGMIEKGEELEVARG